MEKYTGAGTVIESFRREGIEIVAGIPGGSNLPLYDALAGSGIRHILARHEQGAGFMAQGMARSTGKTGVCLATSGPGVTNLITALADAKLDSIPVVAVTGQVSRSLIGTDAFQEVDTFGMTRNITKHNYLVMKASDLPAVMTEAFRIARSGRPGPVLVDIPKDVLTETYDFPGWPPVPMSAAGKERPGEMQLKRGADMINRSARPVIYAGGGIISAGASGALLRFAEAGDLPGALTLMGLGAFPPDHPLYAGMLGMHGGAHTNHILNAADLLIVLGARFDDRAIGNAARFCPHAQVLHVDIDVSEIDKIRKSSYALNCEVKVFLEEILPFLEKRDRGDWHSEISGFKRKYPVDLPDEKDLLDPVNIIRAIASGAPRDAILCTDVGQHQMWAAQHFPVRSPRSFLTSGGLGTMGFGLPTAIGAGLANPGRTVILITGDGSVQMNIQELASLAELGINLKIFILNNRRLGLVRQQQELFYGGNYFASSFDRSPDFAAIAEGYGLKAHRGVRGSDPGEIIREMMEAPGACLADMDICPRANVYPMVPPGGANIEMISRAV